jgi:hypothetical protein
MNYKTIDFLLKYAEIGVLVSMEKANAIKSEELKQEYIEIKKELLKPKETNKETTEKTTKPEEKKESPVKKWFKGVGERQRKYQEKKKGSIM